MFRLAQAAVAEAEPQPRRTSPIYLSYVRTSFLQTMPFRVACLPQPADGQGQPPAGAAVLGFMNLPHRRGSREVQPRQND